MITGGFEAFDEFFRERGAAHLRETLDLFQRQDRHDAGDDGGGDATGAAFFDEAEVDGVVEEELGGDEVAAGVDLALHVVDVGIERSGFGVFFGITGDAEAEIGVKAALAANARPASRGVNVRRRMAWVRLAAGCVLL